MKKNIFCNHCGAINKVDIHRMKIKSPVCGKCTYNLMTTPSLLTIDEKN